METNKKILLFVITIFLCVISNLAFAMDKTFYGNYVSAQMSGDYIIAEKIEPRNGKDAVFLILINMFTGKTKYVASSWLKEPYKGGFSIKSDFFSYSIYDQPDMGYVVFNRAGQIGIFNIKEYESNPSASYKIIAKDGMVSNPFAKVGVDKLFDIGKTKFLYINNKSQITSCDLAGNNECMNIMENSIYPALKNLNVSSLAYKDPFVLFRTWNALYIAGFFAASNDLFPPIKIGGPYYFYWFLKVLQPYIMWSYYAFYTPSNSSYIAIINTDLYTEDDVEKIDGNYYLDVEPTIKLSKSTIIGDFFATSSNKVIIVWRELGNNIYSVKYRSFDGITGEDLGEDFAGTICSGNSEVLNTKTDGKRVMWLQENTNKSGNIRLKDIDILLKLQNGQLPMKP